MTCANLDCPHKGKFMNACYIPRVLIQEGHHISGVPQKTFPINLCFDCYNAHSKQARKDKETLPKTFPVQT